MHHASSRHLAGSTPSRGHTPARLGHAVLSFLRANLVIIGVCAALLLVYTLIGFFFVPRIARSQIEAFVTQTLHQRVSIGELRFNPFTFEASASQVRLTEPNGRELVGFRHLYADAELASLWQRAVVLQKVSLAAPSVQLIVDRNGEVNLKKLQPPAAADESRAQEEESLPVRIGQFSLREGRVAIEDHTRPGPFTAKIEPIRFVLSDFKTDPGHRNGYHFSGKTAAGEGLDWNGEFTVSPLGSTGRFRIDRLQAKTIESYLESSLPFRLASGEANFAGAYRFALDPLVLNVEMPALHLQNLAIAERERSERIPIKADQIELQQLALSLEKQDMRVNRAEVRGAHLDVAREPDGSIDLNRLLASTNAASATNSTSAANSANPASENSAESKSPSTDEWHTSVDTVHIADATVTAEDRSVQPAVRMKLSPVEATINGWRSDPASKMQIDLKAAINERSKLSTNGEVQLEPLTATAKLDLEDLDLAQLQPYVADFAQMTVHSGALNVKGAVEFATKDDNTANAKFSGDVRVENLRTTDNALKQDFVTWRELAVTGIAYEHNPASLAIERIEATQPYARVTIAEDRTLNVEHVLANDQKSTDAESAPRAEAPEPPAQTMPISVRTVRVKNGSADFADRSIQPSFAAKIVDLQGDVAGLSSKPSSRAKVVLNGKVDEYAPVDIEGELNLLAATKYTDLAMNFRNMELTTFNPYSGKFAGYNISKGKLSTELHYRIEDRKLEATHHIVVDNLEFGAKTASKDAAPIPIKLGVALLKDRNGVIDIDLPVNGSLDDPKFRIGPIIWKAVINLLTKIVTAPFAALGAVFGGGEELAYLDFPAGSAELSDADKDKLGKLANALAERPALKLDVPVTLATNEDSAALAHSALSSRIPPDAAGKAEDERAQREQLKEYEKAYKALANQAPEYPEEIKGKDVIPETKRAWLEEQMVAKLQPDRAALDTLARDRARAVQTTLLANTEVAPDRVFITTERAATPTKEGAIRMELKLE